MPEQQSPIPPQNEATAINRGEAKPLEAGDKPRVKYDKETFLNSSRRVTEIRDKIKTAGSLDEIAPLAQEGKTIEHNMRDMFDAAQDEAEAENKAFDERKVEERKQRTLEMAKSGTLSFDEIVDATGGKGESATQRSAEKATKPSGQQEGAQGSPETPGSPEAAREQAIDDAIDKEAAGLEANVQATTTAIEDAGGEDAIKQALEAMPDDGKAALKEKLLATHAKNMEERQKRYAYTVELTKTLGSTLDPRYVRDALIEDTAAGLIATVGYFSGIIPVIGGTAAAYEGAKALKQKMGIKLAERRHKRELQKLEKSS